MWFSFPLGRGTRLGVPWWLFPVVFVVYAAAIMVWLALLIVTAPIWLVVKLAERLTRPRRGG